MQINLMVDEWLHLYEINVEKKALQPTTWPWFSKFW
jgi:hypothetical protein